MPSLSSQFLAKGFSLIQSVHGEQIEILTGTLAGQFFTGTILIAPEIVLTDETGIDPREKCVIHFPDNNWPNAVEGTDTMRDGSGQTWKFIKRINNPQDQTVDFDIVKVLVIDI